MKKNGTVILFYQPFKLFLGFDLATTDTEN